MSGFLGDLNSTQEFALQKFKERVQDVWDDAKHDDHTALRFLRAREFNLDKSEFMFRQNLKWRQRLNLDEPNAESDVAEVLVKYASGNFLGHDKEGSPVMLWCFGNIDAEGLLLSTDLAAFEKFMAVKIFDALSNDAAEQTKRLGKNVENTTVIVDFENFGLKKIFSKQGPRAFPAFWNIVKLVIAKRTVDKVTICSSGDKSWQKSFFELVDPAIVPQHWGGTKVGKNGCPKCSDVINTLGLVDPRYYRKNVNNMLLETTTLEPEDGEEITVFGETGSEIRWKVQGSRDFQFAVGWRDPDAALENAPLEYIVGLKKCDKGGAEGSHICVRDAVYVLQLRNTNEKKETQITYEFYATKAK